MLAKESYFPSPSAMELVDHALGPCPRGACEPEPH